MPRSEAPETARSQRNRGEREQGSASASARTPTPGGARTFASLGTGSADDRLGFRAVLRIFVRTVPLLRTVWRHLGVFVALVVVGTAAALGILGVGYDVVWEAVLRGEPVGALTAAVFLLEPAVYVDVARVPDAARLAVRTQLLWLVPLGFVVVAPFLGGLTYYQTWILQRINQVLRSQMIERLQTLSLRFHADNRVGDSIYRVYQDSAMVTNVIRYLMVEPIRGIGVLSIALIATASVDAGLAAILLLAFPLQLGLGNWFSARMRQGFRRAREASSAVTSRIQETVAGIRVIKAYGAENVEQEKFVDESQQAFAAAFAARSRLATYGVMIFWVSGTALVYVTYAATDLTMSAVGGAAAAVGVVAAWDLGRYNFFKTSTASFSGGLDGLFNLWGSAQDMAIGLDRVFELLDLEAEVTEARDAVPMPRVAREIRFRGVTFAYQPDRPVLRKVDLDVRPGAITAIVGPTGSGKSTLVSLLLRLYDPDEGEIEIDGVNLRQIQLESLRSGIAIALQENVLFGTTIRENIRYAAPDATDAEVEAAAVVAAADGFIREQPQRYDTLLGERGTKLSTGQRQRISIARAILKDTPILILDEPTAALDAQTELEVLGNLAAWGKERAIFIITHRLSTIRRADQIVYVRNGEVVERGAHDELVARESGAYRALVELEESAAAAGDARSGSPA